MTYAHTRLVRGFARAEAILIIITTIIVTTIIYTIIATTILVLLPLLSL